MTDRRQSGSGQSRREGRATSGIPTINPIATVPGLLYWWQVPASGSPLMTLNGGNLSAITERVAGAANMAEGTAAQQPLYVANGGPNDKPYLSLQDSARNIGATVVIGAAHRVGMFAVARQASSGVPSTVVASARAGAGGNRYIMSLDGSSRYRFECTFTGGTQAINATTSPANNGAWRIRAILPLAAAAASQIDRVDTNPTFTGTDTVQSITSVHFGFENAIVCAGDAASIMMVDLTVNSAVAIPAVYAYYAAEYGL